MKLHPGFFICRDFISPRIFLVVKRVRRRALTHTPKPLPFGLIQKESAVIATGDKLPRFKGQIACGPELQRMKNSVNRALQSEQRMRQRGKPETDEVCADGFRTVNSPSIRLVF